MVRIGIMGARGRMGRAITELAVADESVEISAIWEVSRHPDLGKTLRDFGVEARTNPKLDVFPAGLPEVDVVIDFTTPQATLSAVEEVERLEKKIVIGTTGFSDAERQRIRRAGDKIAVVMSPNMSLGVNLLFVLTQLAVSVLPDNYEVEIVEAHHHHKKDAPSGTAMKIWEIIKTARNLSDDKLVAGRKGITGPRSPDEVGIHAIRCADIVGEHTVMFGVEGERLELTHRASSRYAFARGALLAAKFVHQEAKGLYDMLDVMGLRSVFE